MKKTAEFIAQTMFENMNSRSMNELFSKYASSDDEEVKIPSEKPEVLEVVEELPELSKREACSRAILFLKNASEVIDKAYDEKNKTAVELAEQILELAQQIIDMEKSEHEEKEEPKEETEEKEDVGECMDGPNLTKDENANDTKLVPVKSPSLTPDAPKSSLTPSAPKPATKPLSTGPKDKAGLKSPPKSKSSSKAKGGTKSKLCDTCHYSSINCGCTKGKK